MHRIYCWVCFVGDTYTLPDYKYTHKHTFTYTSVNPVEAQRWLHALLLHTSTFKFSGKGVLQMTDGGAPAECPKASPQTVDGTDTPD